MRTPEGNAALEFHDSKVVRVQRHGQSLTVVLAGYIHRSRGRPGVDPGTGWSQDAVLRFGGATIQGGFTSLPVRVWDGTVGTPEGLFKNVIPAPSSFDGPIHLELQSEAGEHVAVG